uniref:Chondroitin proteoglycan 4 domain-containing protein n=1 Tax=Globodera rostochiensis TaxID=31243 RepID=A0A914HEP6_GLORO
MFVPLIRSPFCLFFFINFFTFSRGAPLRIKVPEVHHLKGYRSPLDEGIAPPDSDYFTSAENKPAGGGLEPDFPEEGMEGLLLPSTGGRQTAMQSGNNFDRFKGVCRNYNETVDCMDKLEGERCSNQETFHVFTSGIRYMCIEQRKAFDAVIECMDAQSAEVEKECEEVCHVKERLAHWAVQSGIMDNFMQGALSSLANGETVAAKLFGRGEGIGTFMGLQHRQSGKRTMRTNSNGAKKSSTETAEKGIKDVAATKYRGEKLRLTPDFLRAAVQDGCELMRCQLICYRVKFDAKCGGSAGALLSEAFVRPISQAQEFLTYGHIAPFMGAFLPHQCDFMVKKEVLNEFRIPPELDDALHRKYNLQKGEEDGPSVSPVAEIPNNNGAGNVDENVEQTLLNVSEADPGDRTKVSHVVGTARITKIN